MKCYHEINQGLRLCVFCQSVLAESSSESGSKWHPWSSRCPRSPVLPPLLNWGGERLPRFHSLSRDRDLLLLSRDLECVEEHRYVYRTSKEATQRQHNKPTSIATSASAPSNDSSTCGAGGGDHGDVVHAHHDNPYHAHRVPPPSPGIEITCSVKSSLNTLSD